MMQNTVVVETLRYLAGGRHSRPAKISEFHLTRFFTTAELDDGSVGACMSYYSLPDLNLRVAETLLASVLTGKTAGEVEPEAILSRLAEAVPDSAQCYLLGSAILAAVVSAFSTPSIKAGGDDVFEVRGMRPSGITRDARSALVVGFGGYLESFLKNECSIERIHVLDFRYASLEARLDSELERFRAEHPGREVTVSSRIEPDEFAGFDIVAVTGSTLGNGTLERILASVRKGAKVILQGQSACIHPKILFEQGVSLVATTLKPRAATELARQDYSGEALRQLLDNAALPWIYFVPSGDPMMRWRN
jgi:hypothetical protein